MISMPQERLPLLSFFIILTQHFSFFIAGYITYQI